MLGKRTVYMSAALGAMLLTGIAIGPPLHRELVLNPGLREAIKDRDLNRVERLIAQGANINLTVANADSLRPSSPIALAAWIGDLDAIGRLLSLGAKADLGDSAGTTPLMLAASRDLPDVIRKLLAAGADANARNRRNETALMYAGSYGTASYVGRPGRIHREPDSTNILLAAGADPNFPDIHGVSALSKAELSGERKIANALRAVGAKGLREEWGGMPHADLFYAVRTEDLGAVKRLIRRGARVAVQDMDGMTPLMYAAEQHDGILIRYLLLHAPDVKAALELRDPQGKTVLYRTLMVWDYSFRLLLKAGADPNGTAPNGDSYFRYANKQQQQLLIQAGATPPN